MRGAFMSNQSWVFCPICNNKTRTKIRNDTERYRTDKFSVILSEVQTRNYNQYETWKYNNQRARR